MSKGKAMKVRVSQLLLLILAAAVISVLFLLTACGQSGGSKDSENSTSSEYQALAVSSLASDPAVDDAVLDYFQVLKALSSDAPKMKMSIFDALGGLVDGVKDKVDDAGRQLSEWQEQREKEKEQREKDKLQREKEEQQRVIKVLKDAKLSFKHKTLEYSEKIADPVNLVKCSDSRVRVTANKVINRSKLGTKKVTYTLSYSGQSVERVKEFKVVDTKAPKIDFVSKTPKISVGDAYSPAKNVNYVKDSVDGKLKRVDKAPKAKGKKAGSEVFYEKGWYTVSGKVDTSVEGKYTVDVNASDANGNTTHRTFVVTVEAPEPKYEESAATMMTRSFTRKQADDEQARQAWLNEMVCVTPTGNRYHTNTCSHKGTHDHPEPRWKARDMGLSACGHCNPDRWHPDW